MEDYKIIKGSIEFIEESVNELLEEKDGWEPMGGICSCGPIDKMIWDKNAKKHFNKSVIYHAQAVIKRSKS